MSYYTYKTNKLFSAVIISAVLSSCAGYRVARMVDTGESIKSETTTSLCTAYRNFPKSEILDEIASRNKFSKKDLELIEANEISVGMKRDALFCSWGYPLKTETVGTDYGNYKLYTYRERSDINNVITVYMIADIVSKWTSSNNVNLQVPYDNNHSHHSKHNYHTNINPVNGTLGSNVPFMYPF